MDYSQITRMTRCFISLGQCSNCTVRNIDSPIPTDVENRPIADQRNRIRRRSSLNIQGLERLIANLFILPLDTGKRDALNKPALPQKEEDNHWIGEHCRAGHKKIPPCTVEGKEHPETNRQDVLVQITSVDKRHDEIITIEVPSLQFTPFATVKTQDDRGHSLG